MYTSGGGGGGVFSEIKKVGQGCNDGLGEEFSRKKIIC